MQTLTSLSLKDFSKDTKYFVDSNIFIYFLLGHKTYSPIVKTFFNEIEKGEIKAYINPTIVSEVYFKRILINLGFVPTIG